MSGYYVGPFGQPGDNNPYQLPPPRPATLQFGSDPFLRQRQQTESHEQRRTPPSSEAPSQQLPSVRSLLTPVSGPTSPPTYHQAYSAPPTHMEHRDQAYPFRQHESGVISPLGGQDRSGRPDSLPQPYTPSLPPLSQVAMTSPRDMIHHASRSDPLSATMHNRQLPLHAATFQHESVPTGELSSPESGRSRGTSTLPHVVDEKYIDGEGFCFVYADGSHVPKTIDGIPVNANWGVTKAGKPRKRLAQACLTCREKKIKCQPNLPKCDQCQKSGRECRFESAPRGIRSFRGSQSTGLSGGVDGEDFSPGPSGHSEASPSIYNMGRASESATSLPGTSGQSPISEGAIVTPSGAEGAHETDAERVYRVRGHRVPRHYSEGDSAAQSPKKFEFNRRHKYSEIIGNLPDITPDDPLAGYHNIDPYESDPEMTLHYVESFFVNVNDSLYHIFPHARFILWLRSCHTKSAEDKMLLYAILALGSIFSERPDKIGALRQNYKIARFAIQKNQYTLSLQLVQSHIVMSLLYYATGSLFGSWDSIGAATRAVSGLRYNMESGGVVVDQNHACDFGLHPQALMECRRRTFWVAFILDRVSSLFLEASSTSISSESVLIRLPCRDEIYEAQQYATAPYFQSIFNQGTLSVEDDRSSLSTMAYLVQILSVWGDVSHHIFRLSHTPPDRYAQLAEEVHTSAIRQTDDWTKRLPEHLVFSASNLERACQTKKTDAFVSMHMFYHATLTKLYRNVRYQSLRSDVLAEYVHRARYHAVETLRIVVATLQYAKELEASQSSTDSTPRGSFLNPFLGHVILSAVDVLSAAGLLVDLPNCVSFINGALEMVHTFGCHWDTSLDLANIIQKRLSSMADCMKDRASSQDKPCFTLDGPSLEKKVHRGAPSSSGIPDDDVFYGSMPREALLRAMKVDENSISEQKIVWLRDR